MSGIWPTPLALTEETCFCTHPIPLAKGFWLAGSRRRAFSAMVLTLWNIITRKRRSDPLLGPSIKALMALAIGPGSGGRYDSVILEMITGLKDSTSIVYPSLYLSYFFVNFYIFVVLLLIFYNIILSDWKSPRQWDGQQMNWIIDKWMPSCLSNTTK